MASEPIFLTDDEASSLQAAVESIVSAGIKVQDTDHQIPAGKVSDAGLDAESAEKPGI